MSRKDKYKLLREAGYTAKEASKKSSLGKEKFVSAIYEKGGSRKASKAKKEVYKLSDKQRDKAIDLLPRRERPKAKHTTDKKLIEKVREVSDSRAASLSHFLGLSVARSTRKKETEIELGYKAKYVYIIKLRYESGKEVYINYSTNLPPERVSRSAIYNMVQKHVMYEYKEVLASMVIEEMLED